ncbi:hypothetical protein CTI12_AA190450 [Artemisia annua]|uniref:Adenylate kinase n=1 Tax=Artemisia annua TaxID=35608 RepID=A0A2U1P5V5_ARTAN|nr:hypothetical protein CTI12_AA190450 [Artemisia annua]
MSSFYMFGEDNWLENQDLKGSNAIQVEAYCHALLTSSLLSGSIRPTGAVVRKVNKIIRVAGGSGSYQSSTVRLLGLHKELDSQGVHLPGRVAGGSGSYQSSTDRLLDLHRELDSQGERLAMQVQEKWIHNAITSMKAADLLWHWTQHFPSANQMPTDRLSQPDSTETGWLFDGYPRSSSQATALQAFGFQPHLFILLEVR